MKVLIDADIVAYRCASAAENESLINAQRNIDRMVSDIFTGADHGDRFYKEASLHLTGSNNFRNEIAVTAVYKGNRSNKPKPKHLKALRKHLVDEWSAVIAEGQEADDAITIEATALNGKCIIASLDKDFKQFSGWHYNFIKRQHFFVTPYAGMKFFYTQILMGDSADNIKGLFRVGPKKAEQMLKGCKTENDMYNVCLNAYESPERVLENARLLWLRRHLNEMWSPPDDRSV